MKEVVVPVLGESVTEAVIAKWLKKSGDTVEVDDLLLELETDKVTLEVNALASGTLTDLSFAEGDTVQPGDVLAKIDESGKAAVKSDVTKQDINSPSANSQKDSDTAAKTISGSTDGSGPAVKKMAAENGVDISKITTSGKDGRATKQDVMNSMENKAASSSQPAVNSAGGSSNMQEIVSMTPLRRKIAERLKHSQNTAAILTTFNEVDMTNIMALRAKHQASFIEAHEVKLGFMSFFVKAAVEALKAIPAVNAEIKGTDIIYKHHFDIGVAVGTPQGLVVPVLKAADSLTFAGIESGIAALGKKARDGKLTMSELTGGTFSITNGGVYGSLMSTPIINPPQSAILGMHSIQQRPMAIDGKVEIRPMMYLALSYDHRIIDGKEAVTFLVDIKKKIENPERMLLNI